MWGGSRVPDSVANWLAILGGHLEWMARPRKRAILATNLAHAVTAGGPSVRQLVRREFVNEAHRSADLLWALGRPAEFLARTELIGIEHALGVAAGVRGMILSGVHIGGWELATTIPDAVLPARTSALVTDDWLAWAIQGMRNDAGLHVVYRTEPMWRIGQLLRSGEALVLLSDHTTGPSNRMARVRFLDAAADLPLGVATLARLYQVPIVSFVVVRVGRRRWRVIIDAPMEPPARLAGRGADGETLQRLADRWSEFIREYPDQWAMPYPIAWRPSGASVSEPG